MSTTLDLKDVLNAAYKLNDWLNFYWNFYVVFSGVVIGWVFNSKGWPTSQRVIVSIFYVGFVFVSIDALLSTYNSLSAAVARLNELAPKNDQLVQALAAQLGKPYNFLGIILHVLGDLLIFFAIWRFTQKAPEATALPAGSKG